MKILMIGSYSSLFENYYFAAKNDYNIVLAGNGDGWKSISTSQLYFPGGKNKLSRLFSLIFFLFFKIRDYTGFDLVLIQSPFVFGGIRFYFNFNLFIINFIRKNNKSISMLVAGTDYIVYMSRFDMENNPFDRSIDIDFKGLNPYISRLFVKNNLDVIKLLDRIFFSSPAFGLGYKFFDKCFQTAIPFPAFLSRMDDNPKLLNPNEIIIYHGINRRGFKGSDIILKALDLLKETSFKNYKIIVTERIPLASFIENLKSSDIYIDQCFADDVGMSAILALGLGKVVLTSLSSYCEKEKDCSSSPIIRIQPNEEMILLEIVKLLSSPNELLNRSTNAVRYVENYHDPIESLTTILENMRN